ncbi:F-box/LRR-repeat protein At3g03360 [Setaria viridis]|uniref:F-box/LRR-repeat protein At3g03360 n=1 Tax=Setaria viridis TaxID=4556 RepID=UPI003B3A3AEF
MGVITRAKKRRLEEEQELVDRISRLPDGILGDIVSLLPTKDGARTQVLSSRWRHIWRSAPLNFDIYGNPVREIYSILSSHPGPGRRFTIDMRYVRIEDYAAAAAAAATLGAWLWCPALNSLQELEFYLGRPPDIPPLPASVRRFSCTLRVASFGGCSFPDGNASALQLPLLNQLSLVSVRISETSLHSLLAGCPVLESLLLNDTKGFPRVQIMSTSLRSIGVCSSSGKDRLRQLIIEDAPSLERLLIFKCMKMEISVISAPKLKILGKLSSIQFGTTTFQGSSIVTLTTVVCSVKVLALTDVNLSLDAAINLIKCFSCLEKLYIQTSDLGETNTWYRKYSNLIGTLESHGLNAHWVAFVTGHQTGKLRSSELEWKS